MSVLRPFVTIGPHHHGPHVDALYALAERVGGVVIVLDAKGEVTTPVEPGPHVRMPYAGYEPADAARFHRWEDAR